MMGNSSKYSIDEYIQNLIREGEQIKSTDQLISYLENFLFQEFNKIFFIEDTFHPLIFINGTVTPILDKMKNPLVLGMPAKMDVRYIEYKDNDYYLVTCPFHLLNFQLIESKDPNFPTCKVKIKSDKKIFRKKISKKIVQTIYLKLKLLIMSYSLGFLEGIQKATVQHAHNRKSNNISLISHNNISYQLANNLIQISKLKAVLTNCNELIYAGCMNSMAENILMYLNDQTHQIVIDSAMQIFGAQSLKAGTLPAIGIKRSLVLRGMTDNKTVITDRIKSDLLKKAPLKRRSKNIYSFGGI